MPGTHCSPLAHPLPPSPLAVYIIPPTDHPPHPHFYSVITLQTLRRLRNELDVKESLLREKDDQLLQRERQYTQTIRRMKRQQNILLDKLSQLESAINATLGASGLGGGGGPTSLPGNN